MNEDPAVWHDLFFKTFGQQPNPFTMYKWPEMYRWRSKAGFFTWGSLGAGRLGFMPQDIEEEYKTAGGERGVCRPKRVEQLGSTVVADMVSGGFSSTILTAHGQLYGTGDLHTYGIGNPVHTTPGVVALPIRQTPVLGGHRIRIGGVRNPPRTAFGVPGNNNPPQPEPEPRPSPFQPHRSTVINDNESQAHPGVAPQQNESSPSQSNPESPEKENIRTKATKVENLSPPLNVIERSQLKELQPNDLKFVSISEGRTHLLALDEYNDIWIWDRSFAFRGTKLSFSFNEGKKKSILRLAAGWGFSAALVSEVGIVVWFQLGGLQHANYEKKGENMPEVSVEHYIVPGTSNVKIIDIVPGEGFIVYLTKAGQLYRYDTSSKDAMIGSMPIRLHGFEDALTKRGGQAQFTKLSGSFRKFAIFTDKEDVFLGTEETSEQTEPTVLPELQRVGCISIAFGDHHNLALVRGGKLLSWGRESRCCGCLGLGTRSEVVEKYNAEVIGQYRDLIVEKPTPVEVDGYVLAIAASGWQSSAIISDEVVE